jgi:hypothetical protein
MAEGGAARRDEEQQLGAAMSARRTPLAGVHLLVGAATLVGFLISGVYMLVHDPALGKLDLGLHLLYTSRHIYVLAAALIHLVLGAHVGRARTRGVRGVQWAGSMMLVVASGLLMLAFVAEPVGTGHRTPLSRFGLYSLFVGTILHIGTGLRSRGAELAVAPDAAHTEAHRSSNGLAPRR